METKHTKGPWHIGMKPGPIIYGLKGEQIADLRPHFLVDDEHAANVRLIAAAPDLLEALEDITSAYERALNRFGAHEWGTLTIEDARAIIAKARGQDA